jgi:alkylation response protein AidB-like acyl-CoA dehydrogenase
VLVEASADGRITGTKTLVLDGTIASLLIVAARGPGGDVGLYAVEGDADGLTRTAQEPLDMTRKLARLDLDGVRATRLRDVTWDAIAKTLDHAAVLLAAEMAGGAARCLDMAVEYAKSRYQFGKPIGAFQAIKHRCADILLQVESARTAAYYAMWAAAEGDPDLRIAAPLAKAYCADAYFFAASENHQVHGGIGFTWEHDAHLYFRRAKSSDLLFGDSNHQRDLLADRLGF